MEKGSGKEEEVHRNSILSNLFWRGCGKIESDGVAPFFPLPFLNLLFVVSCLNLSIWKWNFQHLLLKVSLSIPKVIVLIARKRKYYLWIQFQSLCMWIVMIIWIMGIGMHSWISSVVIRWENIALFPWSFYAVNLSEDIRNRFHLWIPIYLVVILSWIFKFGGRGSRLFEGGEFRNWKYRNSFLFF